MGALICNCQNCGQWPVQAVGMDSAAPSEGLCAFCYMDLPYGQRIHMVRLKCTESLTFYYTRLSLRESWFWTPVEKSEREALRKKGRVWLRSRCRDCGEKRPVPEKTRCVECARQHAEYVKLNRHD